MIFMEQPIVWCSIEKTKLYLIEVLIIYFHLLQFVYRWKVYSYLFIYESVLVLRLEESSSWLSGYNWCNTFISKILANWCMYTNNFVIYFFTFFFLFSFSFLSCFLIINSLLYFLYLSFIVLNNNLMEHYINFHWICNLLSSC